jgi:hypothetical protein
MGWVRCRLQGLKCDAGGGRENAAGNQKRGAEPATQRGECGCGQRWPGAQGRGEYRAWHGGDGWKRMGGVRVPPKHSRDKLVDVIESERVSGWICQKPKEI